MAGSEKLSQGRTYAAHQEALEGRCDVRDDHRPKIIHRGAMMGNDILREAKALHDIGFAIHWLKPKSKMPVESGWTTGPRKEWSELKRTYRKGYNVGVRLGKASTLKEGVLSVIDVDVKSKDPRHREEVSRKVAALLEGQKLPLVRTGRGGGSRHYYILSKEPFHTFSYDRSSDLVKVRMPSAGQPSKRDREKLSEKELNDGFRIRAAWEIGLMCEGSQVVLPPSIHPDSGEKYIWKRPFIPTILGLPSAPEKEKADIVALDDFKAMPVDLNWLDMSDGMRKAIATGERVTDRSAFLLKASAALYSAGLTQDEVLSVLTDPKLFMGQVGYDHAKTHSRRRAADWVFKYTFRKVKDDRGDAKEIFKNALPPVKILTEKDVRKQNEEILAERHWTQDIKRNQQGTPQKTVENVVHILSNAIGKDCIRRDEFAYRDIFFENTPFGARKGDVASDDHLARIKYWLGKRYGFEPQTGTISDALIVLACENAFDPVKNFLDDLPAWDGTPRLNTWLVDNFKAKGDPEYLAQVFRKWMVGMVMRAYEPGSKFDWMIIFEGKQEIGKSSFGKILSGADHFHDNLPPLHEKDSSLALQGAWIVEMGELSQFRKNEIETIKSFLSRTVDKFRPPYGRRNIESPRRCVFFGTTNRHTYLIDETGNRRFKPVEVKQLDFEALRRDRLQLFAEAKHLYVEKLETEFSLGLSGEARIYERNIQAEKMVEDDSNSMEESMRNFIEKVKKGELVFDLKRFKILELFEGGGPLAHWRKDNRNIQFAAKMLRRLGGQFRLIHGLKTWKIEISRF